MKTTIRIFAACAFYCASFIAGFAAAPRFLDADPQAFILQLPPPPADDTPVGRADLETLLQLQKDRTPAQVERAVRVNKQTPMSPGVWVFGAEFTEKNLPRTAALLQKITLENRPLINAAKDRFKRPRPYRRDEAVTPCVKKHTSDSYPSGHSAGAALWCAFLSAAMPEYQPLFEKYVHEAMWCRVLAGVHFPSDTQAGRMLGRLSAAEMLKTPAAREAVAEIRAEILSFLKTHPKCVPVSCP